MENAWKYKENGLKWRYKRKQGCLIHNEQVIVLFQRSEIMATISGYNSYSMGVLFSGLNTTSSKNSLFSNSMSGSDILGINYSDWATIRSGSYFKLLNAYYGKGGQVSASDDTTSSSTSTSKDSTRTLAVIESDAKSWRSRLQLFRKQGINPYLTKWQRQMKMETRRPVMIRMLSIKLLKTLQTAIIVWLMKWVIPIQRVF